MTSIRRTARPVRGAFIAGAACALAACGGGIQDDSNGSAQGLVCATTCKPSNTLSPGDVRASFALVSDGSQVQAQAGFSSGSDLRFNVEITGGDTLQLRTARGVQPFHIPASSLSTILVDAFRTLIAGATPYLSEVAPTDAASSVAFEWVRGTTVLSSSVLMPAAFQVVSPASGASLPIATRTLAVTLSSAGATPGHSASFNCKDANGNTASAAVGVEVVAGSETLTASSRSYALDIGRAIDQLGFTTTFPRAVVSQCDVKLTWLLQSQGQPDPRFASAQVFAQQIRTSNFTMR